MEIEHQEAGDALAAIRDRRAVTGRPRTHVGRTASCEEINAFERDPDTHVRLENKVLFPKAVEVESTVEHTTRAAEIPAMGTVTGDI